MAKNQTYKAIVPEKGFNVGCTGAIHSLLNLAKNFGRGDVSQCCEMRISILLLNDHDARSESQCPGALLDQYPKSPTGFALTLGNPDLRKEALRHARWSEYEIQELFDDEVYIGVPELLSGWLAIKPKEIAAKISWLG
jgi:hypothetical protein